MVKNSGVALGAGLASALLFVVSAKGTAVATLVAYFTALPIIIAALGYGHLSGLAGALIGSVAVSAAIGPVLGVFYAISFVLPAWWLSYLALLARPAEASDLALPGGAAVAGPVWYPLSRIVAWAVAVASGSVLLLGLALLIRFGGYAATTSVLTRHLAEALAPAAGQSSQDSQSLAALLVRVLPLAMAPSTCLMLLANLWLGARISQTSHRLPRPWPNVPDGLRLPKAALGVLGACVVLGLIPVLDEAAGTAAATVAAALGLVFALQGLGTAHVITRGFTGRRVILTLIYLVTMMVPPAIVALTLLGIVDTLGSLRSRRLPPPPPNQTKGVPPWK